MKWWTLVKCGRCNIGIHQYLIEYKEATGIPLCTAKNRANYLTSIKKATGTEQMEKW